jgi:hypothetical protein
LTISLLPSESADVDLLFFPTPSDSASWPSEDNFSVSFVEEGGDGCDDEEEDNDNDADGDGVSEAEEDCEFGGSAFGRNLEPFATLLMSSHCKLLFSASKLSNHC